MYLKKKTYTFEDIANGTVIPMGWKTLEKYNAVDWVEGNDKDHARIPRIQFRWIEKQYIGLTDDQADQLLGMGLRFGAKIEKSSEVNKEGYTHRVWAAVADKDGCPYVTHRTLCNFRRYGWSWTSEHAGEYGYGNGVTYANCEYTGVVPRTEEEVIRESLVATIASMDVPRSMKFNCGVKPLWDDLLEDALKHKSRFATGAINSDNGCVGTLKVNGVDFDWRASV